ncbi:hypothetical protein N0V94_002466 [Neodidymelliopsis sp. IMI 364377]|nr:hypothetical protein N0V94_002466 [Neodidymelliopsis sp. IMI 364377]
MLFASQDWMTIPFANMPRNAHHDLADIMLMIPACIGLCNIKGSLRTFFRTPIPSGIDIEPCRRRTRELIKDLDAWATAYPYLATLASDLQIVAADMATLAVSGVKPAFEGSTTNFVLPDSFVALTVATFKSVELTLDLLLHKLNTQDPKLTQPSSLHSPETAALFDKAVQSANMVLKTAGHLEETKTVGFDFIRSVTPVVVVAILGPTEEQIDNAMAMLKRWGEKRGMNGLVGAWMHL